MKGKCHECRWYKAGPNRKGECHFNPPYTINTSNGLLSQYAVVVDEDWCGRWEIKPEVMIDALKKAYAKERV